MPTKTRASFEFSCASTPGIFSAASALAPSTTPWAILGYAWSATFWVSFCWFKPRTLRTPRANPLPGWGAAETAAEMLWT